MNSSIARPQPSKQLLRSEAILYTVRYQRRKTIALHVLGDGEFEVRAPVGYRNEWIREFVASRTGWALAARDRQLYRQRWRQPVTAGADAWLLGEPLRIELVPASRFSVAVEDGVLRIACCDTGDRVTIERKLQSWFRARALLEFSERLAACCARFPRPIAAPPLALRRMRRRWGSCSRFGEITLNVDLVRLAPELIDYVIMHELCHIFEFNHGPRFYALQSQAVPDWRACEAWLKQF